MWYYFVLAKIEHCIVKTCYFEMRKRSFKLNLKMIVYLNDFIIWHYFFV